MTAVVGLTTGLRSGFGVRALVVGSPSTSTCESSACAAAGGKPSQVIMAINVQKEYAYGTVRITISHENTRDEIDRTVEIMKKLIKLQREQ